MLLPHLLYEAADAPSLTRARIAGCTCQLLAWIARLGVANEDDMARAIVALSGAHTLGSCKFHVSGYIGKFDPTEITFDELYYTRLLRYLNDTDNPWRCVR